MFSIFTGEQAIIGISLKIPAFSYFSVICIKTFKIYKNMVDKLNIILYFVQFSAYKKAIILLISSPVWDTIIYNKMQKLHFYMHFRKFFFLNWI